MYADVTKPDMMTTLTTEVRAIATLSWHNFVLSSGYFSHEGLTSSRFLSFFVVDFLSQRQSVLLPQLTWMPDLDILVPSWLSDTAPRLRGDLMLKSLVSYSFQ
ncbi:hypothetical protein F2Q69_00022219 [Brassica cretica]|uniref:Uncharacterized protein n=1 Tax=Brassica cretica TaxID=69181 RepID=A0A8S9QLC8_BRACR|nr:hypothetical protein F2Q69_00022219 [Brassica cretica]